ncbi:DUF4333 domain-containing protein [Actinophytocola sp. NPDC049390]|uniref:DUF4333 domain-containing protein n=1 Tax=Actinophytocola sp. NPDC049390 TaxID=3363894 RepID=UPI00378C8955
MPTSRSVARTLIAASAVVVAASVALVAVRFTIAGVPLTIRYETTRDTSYFAPDVLDALQERGGSFVDQLSSVDCSSDEKVMSGMAFRCGVVMDGVDYTVRVLVVDVETGEIEVGELSDRPR